jgi:hypothetical protein
MASLPSPDDPIYLVSLNYIQAFVLMQRTLKDSVAGTQPFPERRASWKLALDAANKAVVEAAKKCLEKDEAWVSREKL